MTELLGGWVRTIAAVAIICSAALMLTPSGKAKSVLKIVCALVMVFSVISPLMNKKLPLLSMDIAQYKQNAQEVIAQAKEEETKLNRTIIEEQCAAYILNKAQSLGIEGINVSVSAKWGDEGCWYPYEISILGEVISADKNRLSNLIAGELGIPAQRQNWGSNNG